LNGIYMIGGVSGTGKSSIARKVSEIEGLPYTSTGNEMALALGLRDYRRISEAVESLSREEFSDVNRYIWDRIMQREGIIDGHYSMRFHGDFVFPIPEEYVTLLAGTILVDDSSGNILKNRLKDRRLRPDRRFDMGSIEEEKRNEIDGLRSVREVYKGITGEHMKTLWCYKNNNLMFAIDRICNFIEGGPVSVDREKLYMGEVRVF